MNHDPKKPIFPNRIKELRQIHQLTQEQFAERIEIATNTVSRIERGKMILSSEIALKVADTFQISLDWLFYRSDERLSPRCRDSCKEAFECMDFLLNN